MYKSVIPGLVGVYIVFIHQPIGLTVCTQTNPGKTNLYTSHWFVYNKLFYLDWLVYKFIHKPIQVFYLENKWLYTNQSR